MQRITGTNTINLGGGNLGFQDRNLSAGIAGTTVLAGWLNGVQEELVGIITTAGLTPSGADLGQVLAGLEVLFATLASPHFSGVPTAATAAPGTNTTQLASTAFVAAAIAGCLSVTGIWLANPGYIVFSSGLIVQWADGTVDPANNTEPNQTITLPLTFPHACLSATVTTNLTTISGGADFVYQGVGKTASSVSVIRQAVGGGIYSGSTTWPTVLAIGF
jgi:hypothetical protein